MTHGLPESAEVDRLIERYAPDIQELIQAARRTLRNAFPGVTETADMPGGLLGYGYGAGYKGTVATLILSKTGIKIGIPYGASLEDPAHLLAGAGKVHRHVAIRRVEQLKTPALAALLKQALAAWHARS